MSKKRDEYIAAIESLYGLRDDGLIMSVIHKLGYSALSDEGLSAIAKKMERKEKHWVSVASRDW